MTPQPHPKAANGSRREFLRVRFAVALYNRAYRLDPAVAYHAEPDE